MVEVSRLSIHRIVPSDDVVVGGLFRVRQKKN